MARNRSVQDLTVDELRQLLIEKRRSERQRRLEAYRQTGRVIMVDPQPVSSPLDSRQSEPLVLEGEAAARPTRSRSRTWLDRFLFLVEAVAVIGLGLVLFNGMNVLRNLNKEVAAVLEQPTSSPTPLISAVVLPSGHTPPDQGATSFNEAEIPEHLRPLVQSLAAIPLPTPSPAHAIRIQIPAIGVDAPVVQGDGWEQLKKGVGQHVGTPNPGEDGNIVLSAHNDVFGEIFRYLDQLKAGDEVIVSTAQQAYVYVVKQSQLVEPTRVEVMEATTQPIVTLISCYPYLVDNQRIVVTAELQGQK